MSTPVNRYGSLAARVYHLDKPIGRSFGDIEHYHARLAGCDGPVLEPAVGNGRVLIPLLEAGLDVGGFDASEEMLALCRAECARRGLTARLSRQSFESFVCEEPVAAIILPAGSFQLVADAAAAQAALTRFHEALRPGGRLLIDLDPLADLAETAELTRSWESGEETLTLRLTRVETDFVRQRAVSQLRYELWREGRLVETELEIFALRLWGVLEFELALRAAGFETVAVCGDYRLGAAPEASARAITFEATK